MDGINCQTQTLARNLEHMLVRAHTSSPLNFKATIVRLCLSESNYCPTSLHCSYLKCELRNERIVLQKSACHGAQIALVQPRKALEQTAALANGCSELCRKCAEVARKVCVGQAKHVVCFQVLEHPVVKGLFSFVAWVEGRVNMFFCMLSKHATLALSQNQFSKMNTKLRDWRTCGFL
jgi:hypothetical protein